MADHVNSTIIVLVAMIEWLTVSTSTLEVEVLYTPLLHQSGKGTDRSISRTSRPIHNQYTNSRNAQAIQIQSHLNPRHDTDSPISTIAHTLWPLPAPSLTESPSSHSLTKPVRPSYASAWYPGTIITMRYQLGEKRCSKLMNGFATT